MHIYKADIAEFIIRSFLGILFFFQGYDKVFRVKMPNVINAFSEDAQLHHIPRPWLAMMAYYTSGIELIGGLALILGLFTNYTLCFLGTDLLLVCFAFSLVRPMWDMQYIFPRLILLVTLLLLPYEYNKLSIDCFLNLK